MSGSIVCGVDESESAKGAARVARELSARLRLRLVFVRVVEEGVPDEKIAAITSRLHHLSEGATEVDGGAHWLVDVGHPADRLAAIAKEQNAAMIVVGSTGPRSSLLGSVSADVSRRAPCPVVVVAPDADRPFVGGHHAVQAGTRFLGLLDDGDTEDARDFAGGIVRFSLGGLKS